VIANYQDTLWLVAEPLAGLKVIPANAGTAACYAGLTRFKLVCIALVFTLLNTEY
jgi:hypothetical protein